MVARVNSGYLCNGEALNVSKIFVSLFSTVLLLTDEKHFIVDVTARKKVETLVFSERSNQLAHKRMDPICVRR